VHTFFIAFVLAALGILSLSRPDLLLAPSELARLLLVGIFVFWAARLLIQPFVFDPAMRSGSLRSPLLRIGLTVLWASYLVIYGAALLGQLDAAGPP
jgi:hypothetical protein